MEFKTAVKVVCPDCPDATITLKCMAIKPDGNVVLVCGCTNCGETITAEVNQSTACERAGRAGHPCQPGSPRPGRCCRRCQ